MLRISLARFAGADRFERGHVGGAPGAGLMLSDAWPSLGCQVVAGGWETLTMASSMGGGGGHRGPMLRTARGRATIARLDKHY